VNKKNTTISVRIPSKLSQNFQEAGDLLGVNKADFLRGCIEKLCHDNSLLVENYPKMDNYLNDLKTALGKLKNVRIENGTWENAVAASMFVLCDDLWSLSKKVFDCWKELLREYNLTYWDSEKQEEITDFSQAKDGTFDFEDFGLLMAEKSPIEIDDLLEEGLWYDLLEMKKVTLLLSVLKAIKKHSAETIIGDYLKTSSNVDNVTRKTVVIDATGKFSRSGNRLIYPVQVE
jgi:hypothetical protein